VEINRDEEADAMRRIRSVIVLFLGIAVFLTTVGAGAAEPEHQFVQFTLTTNKMGERRMFVGAEGKIKGVVNPNINVKAWDVVEITLVNGDDLHHHIAIPDFYIMSEVVSEKGKKTTITFVPFKSGEFVYYCLLEGHRQHGMEGRLVVSSR
jgi:plastocyanin